MKAFDINIDTSLLVSVVPIENYKTEVKRLNERLIAKELTLKEYTELLNIQRMILVENIESNNEVKTY
jgi:hypothetical protein